MDRWRRRMFWFGVVVGVVAVGAVVFVAAVVVAWKYLHDFHFLN